MYSGDRAPARAAGALRRGCAIGLALLTALLAGCGRAPEPPKPQLPGALIEGDSIAFPKDSPQLATLRLVAAAPERESIVRINGRTTWDETRTSRVSTPLAGRVLEVFGQPGAEVARGATLATITSPEFGAAQADARKAQTDLAAAERTLQRVRELHQAGVVPGKELQAAEADQQRAFAESARAAARERAYGGGKLIDQRLRLVAPIAGVVVERHLAVGQQVRPEQGAESPLFVISDPRRLWVSLDVPEALTREVAVGEGIRIAVPALPGEVFNARIEYVADMIDPQTRTVRARAAVGNEQRRLKAEMYVTADVEVPASNALKVPATALFVQGERYFAFVEEQPGRFVRRAVQAEEMSLGFMRVIKGLQADDKVVADGALLLQQMLNQKATAPRRKPGLGEVLRAPLSGS